jgi:protein involved in polysaccharide export with SLBB domain
MSPPRPLRPSIRRLALLFAGAAVAFASPRGVLADPPASADGAAPAVADASPAPIERTDWRPGDEFDIRVLNRTELSCVVKVQADGSIDVPFAGRYVMTGRRMDQVLNEVKAAFEKLQQAPQIAITLRSLAPDTFGVMGEVGKSGTFSFPRGSRISMLQALGMAGGWAAEADFSRVKLITAMGQARIVDAGPGQIERLATIPVTNGDTIYVPNVGRIYLTGQLNRTGAFAPRAGERMTLSRAIALGGGFTRLANTHAVVVKWTTPEGREESRAYDVGAILSGRGGEDPVVFAGNQIDVPERLL